MSNMRLFYAEHDMSSRPRYRVWTDEQARYGQFDVIEYDQFQVLKQILGNLSVVTLIDYETNPNGD